MANFFQWIRLLCLMLLAVNFLFYFMFFKVQWFFFSSSNWTLAFTTGSVYVSYEAAWNVDKFSKLALKRAREQGRKAYADKAWHHAGHHFLYCISAILNVFALFVYWPFCHREAVETMSKQPITGTYKIIH